MTSYLRYNVIHRRSSLAKARFLARGQPRVLGRHRYLAVVAGGLVLASLQLLVLPHLLSAYQFGLLLIGISVTQAGLLFGDLGLDIATVNVRHTLTSRSNLREGSYSSFWLVHTTAISLVLVLWIRQWNRELCLVIGLSLATSLVSAAPRLRARAAEAIGDERRAALHNFVWANVPKLGMFPAAVVSGRASWTVFGGFLGAAIVSRPPAPRFRSVQRRAIKSWKLWAPGFLYAASSFLVMWGDTYLIAGRLGLGAAAGYETTYRVLASVTYFYNPFSSMLFARVSARGISREVLTSVVVPCIAVTGATVSLLGLGMWQFAPSLFPTLPIRRDVIIPLAALFLLGGVSYVAGASLLAMGKGHAVTAANVASFVVALAGHLLFTLHGGPLTASLVSLSAVAVSAASQLAMVISIVAKRALISAVDADGSHISGRIAKLEALKPET